ncbi:unnamed protein product [Boreogadus saida]
MKEKRGGGGGWGGGEEGWRRRGVEEVRDEGEEGWRRRMGWRRRGVEVEDGVEEKRGGVCYWFYWELTSSTAVCYWFYWELTSSTAVCYWFHWELPSTEPFCILLLDGFYVESWGTLRRSHLVPVVVPGPVLLPGHSAECTASSLPPGREGTRIRRPQRWTGSEEKPAPERTGSGPKNRSSDGAVGAEPT